LSRILTQCETKAEGFCETRVQGEAVEDGVGSNEW